MDILANNPDFVIERLELGKWKTNAYIIVCKSTGKSGLIDIPSGAPTIIKHLRDTTLECMLLTHNHRDHTGGLRTLRERILAPLAINEFDNQKILPIRPDMALSDGDNVIIGNLRIQCIYTPGHTPGSMCFKLDKYLFSGDTIFPGGPGRTNSPEQFERIIKSIGKKIIVLPDDTEVFPGHGPATVLKIEKQAFDVFLKKEHPFELCGDVLWTTS